MRPEPTQTLEERAVALWRYQAALRALLVLLFVSPFAPVLWALPAITAAALGTAFSVGFLLWAALSIAVFPRLRWRLWRYDLDAHELDLRRGLFVVRRTLVPLIRVQHVDTVQGPIGKRLGLSSVTVSTAAGKHEIPALSDTAADALRDRISALAREARESL
jgi:membrane protein YdbS with pleckstrin-like domain